MILCGYYTDKKHVSKYLKNPDKALVAQAHGVVNYGACLLWSTYVYDRLGKRFLGALVAEKSHGIEGFNSTLRTLGLEGKFAEYFGDWMVSLYLNDPRIDDGKYCLRSIDLPTAPTTETITSYPVNINGSVNGFGIDYIKFDLSTTNIGELGITLRGGGPQLLVKIIKINKERPALTEIADIQSKEVALKIDNTGNLYQEVVLAVTVPQVTDEPVRYRLTALGVPLRMSWELPFRQEVDAANTQ